MMRGGVRGGGLNLEVPILDNLNSGRGHRWLYIVKKDLLKYLKIRPRQRITHVKVELFQLPAVVVCGILTVCKDCAYVMQTSNFMCSGKKSVTGEPFCLRLYATGHSGGHSLSNWGQRNLP